MSRLNPIAPTDMNDAQRQLFESITGGARAKNSSVDEFLNDEGALRGPFNALLRAPELGDLVQKVGEKVRFGTSLSGRLRELAILTGARHWRANYEWFAHKRIAIREGLSDASIDAVMNENAPNQAEEAVVWEFVRELNRTGRVKGDTYDAALELLGEEGVTELTILSGYYALIAQLLNTFEVPVPRDQETPFPD